MRRGDAGLDFERHMARDDVAVLILGVAPSRPPSQTEMSRISRWTLATSGVYDLSASPDHTKPPLPKSLVVHL
jgi:hypothetical protein